MAMDIERDSDGNILFWGYCIDGGSDLGRLLDTLRRLRAAITRSTDHGRVGELLGVYSELHLLMCDDGRWPPTPLARRTTHRVAAGRLSASRGRPARRGGVT